MTFGQFGPTHGDKRGWVETLILFSAGNTAFTLRFLASAFLVAGEQEPMTKREYLRGPVPCKVRGQRQSFTMNCKKNSYVPTRIALFGGHC